jgi:hypothetical protein
MKKLISIALIAAAFALVGCTTERDTLQDTRMPVQKENCKGKKCHHHHHHYHGKLGAEKNTGDTYK